MFPENLLAMNQNDGSVYLSWNEVVEYNCNAEAPYSDLCYAQVIEADSYCCDFSWDGLCESAYNDCINRDILPDKIVSNNLTRNNSGNFCRLEP